LLYTSWQTAEEGAKTLDGQDSSWQKFIKNGDRPNHIHRFI
jgi:hypothetical protein